MAPRLHASLTAPGINRLGLIQWLLVSVTIGALMTAGWLLWSRQDLNDQTIQLEQDLNELHALNQQLMTQARSQGFELTNDRIQALSKEVTFAKRVRTQIGFSWTQFLNDLEAVVPSKVSLDSVTLNYKEASISLNGSAATLGAVNRFVNGLEQHSAFHHVVLSQHAYKKPKKNTGIPQYVKFTMKVSYQRASS